MRQNLVSRGSGMVSNSGVGMSCPELFKLWGLDWTGRDWTGLEWTGVDWSLGVGGVVVRMLRILSLGGLKGME